MRERKLVAVTTPVARVAHTCSSCGKEIEPGRKYCNYLYRNDGKLERHYLHLECSAKPSNEPKRIHNTSSLNVMPTSENELKDIAKKDTSELLEKFSFVEHMKICFVPLVISEMAWTYACKAMDYAIANRVPNCIKATRTLKELRKSYIEELGKDLDEKHRKR